MFSPESWNPETEIPVVAYKNENNLIQFTDGTEEIYSIEDDEIPTIPIVVVKPSERVVLKNTSSRNLGSTIFSTENGLHFSFEYEEFNNINPRTKIQTRSTPTDYPDKLKKIYDAKKYSDQNGVWQRDFVYYNISTKNGIGAFQKNISECIYSFELTGDPSNMYRLIADQGDDPHYSENGIQVENTGGSRTSRPYVTKYWYNGNFEFIVKTYVSNTQLISNEIIKAISIAPDDLFVLNMENKNYDRYRFAQRVIGIKELKKYYLPTPLPIFDWNIEFYSSSIKISIEEKDNDVTE